MVSFNFPEKLMTINDEPIFPSRMEIPDWFITSLGSGIKRVGMLATLDKVEKIGDFVSEGILTSELFGEPEFDNPLALHDHFLKNIPVETEDDVVEWMVYATTNNAWNLSVANEYERAGSLFLAKSSDPYIPGLSIEDLRYASETGETVANRGYAVVMTPQGNYNVPIPGKKTIITKNLLAWGAVTIAYIKQWVGVLAKFKELANNPQSRIKFPTAVAQGGFMNGPLFIGHAPSRRAMRNFITVGITSSKDQTVRFVWRNPNDYTQVFATLNARVPAGQSQVNIKFRSLFGVPPMVVEVQPQDNVTTYLDYYKVAP